MRASNLGHDVRREMFGYACNVIGLGLLALIGYMLFRDPRRIGGLTVALTAAALSLFFGNIDEIESLTASASGFNVKTREVRQVITDAKDTITLLRKLAVVTAGLQVKMLAAEGRLQGPDSLLQKDVQKEELLSELKNIGLNEDEIVKVAAADNAWVKWDYVIAILQPINSPTDRTQIIAYTNAYKRYTNPLSPKECEELLNQFNANSDKTKTLLEDYRYYLKYGKHRRPEVWREHPTGLEATPSVLH
jgi:hypothetical protein